MSATVKLATLMHDAKCVGARNGYCDGGQHLALYKPTAAAVLSAADPAAELHKHVCFAELQAYSMVANGYSHPGCGPDYDRHLEYLRRWLSRHGFTAPTQPALPGVA